MSSIVNKIKDAVHDHKDKDNKTTDTHTTTGTTGTYGGADNTGSGFSGDQMTSSTGVSGAPGGVSSSSGPTGEYGREGYTTGSSNRGPHDSNAMNKADPRVDSDRDGRAAGGFGSSTTAGGLGSTGPTEFGSSNTASTEYGSQGYTAGSSNRGPHDSNLANKADPRVDSDRDGRAAGGFGSSTTAGGIGSTGTTGSSGLGSTGPTEYGSQGYTAGSSNRGPHDSNLTNKADPRVDSDRDGRAAGGFGSSTTAGGIGSTGATGSSGLGSSGLGSSGPTEYGSQGYTAGSSNRGPHDSNAMNKADPRVDSDRDGRAAGGLGSSNTYGTSGTTGTTGGLMGSSNPGPAPNTAGPHGNDMLNKADPRVDSDLDGSKTMMGDKTYNTRS